MGGRERAMAVIGNGRGLQAEPNVQARIPREPGPLQHQPEVGAIWGALARMADCQSGTQGFLGVQSSRRLVVSALRSSPIILAGACLGSWDCAPQPSVCDPKTWKAAIGAIESEEARLRMV